MYYLDEIMDRTFDSWSRMLGANNNSFWASSEIEMKPSTSTYETSEDEPTPSAPAETPAWEPADANNWNDCSEGSSESNPVHEAVKHIADTARDVIDDINPFTDRDSENS